MFSYKANAICMAGMTMPVGAGHAASHQCCQNFGAPNRGKFAFLPAASDFKVAQFLSSNHTPNFPNLGAFQP